MTPSLADPAEIPCEVPTPRLASMLMRRMSLRAIRFTLASPLQLSAAVAMTLGRAVGLRPQRPTERRLFLRVGALESGMRIMLVVGVAENERP